MKMIHSFKVVGLLSVIAVVLGMTTLHAMPRELPGAHGTCPSGNARAEGLVHRLLTAPALSQFRSQMGISAVGSASLRLLTDQNGDAAVCQYLDAYVDLGPYGAPVYYEAGGFYFVTAIPREPDPGRLIVGQVPVAVLDSTFAERGVLGM
jgi:hypothetical protein